MAEYTLTLPNGETLAGVEPVVIIGPNGSGKQDNHEISQQTRTLNLSMHFEIRESPGASSHGHGYRSRELPEYGVANPEQSLGIGIGV